MYYELYIDVLFLVNFMMDYLLLCLIKKILVCSATHKRILFGAAAGAFLTCIIVMLPITYTSVKFILFHGVVNGLMIWAGLDVTDKRTFIKAYVFLYIGGFLLGGILQFLQQYIRNTSLFFGTAVVGYCLISKIWDYIKSVQRIQEYHCRVILYMGDRTCEIIGMIDTGNGLHDPVTKQPVSILDRKTAKKFLGEYPLSRVTYIPYHSIGKAEGVLMALKIDKMQILGKQKYEITEPMIGISEEEITIDGDYQMILHPNLF